MAKNATSAGILDGAYGPCDSCGAPATTVAVDVLRHEVPGMSWVASAPTGLVKRGCRNHPAESAEHVTQLPPRGLEAAPLQLSPAKTTKKR
jgi:hypothetical protein